MSSIVESMNLHPDPRCLSVRSAWHGTWVMSGEKRRYSLVDDGASRGSCFAWGPTLTNAQMAGMVLYARIADADETVLANLDAESASTIIRQDGWIAARAYGATNNHTLPLAYGPFTLCEVGVYSPDDWERIYAAYQAGEIQYPWVAGPRNGGRGPWEL